MKVLLIGQTFYDDGDMTATGVTVCANAAAMCTGSDNRIRSLRGALLSGHESVLEHASFTFKVKGVSRVLLAQLTRHRLASFSVRSQRYCKMTEIEVVTPPSIRGTAWEDQYVKQCIACFGAYQGMIMDGIAPEDARYILPEAWCCDLIVTMNARELRHFFELRCCNRAQWEIRELAEEMMALSYDACRELFADAGPGCVRGRCPEGKMSCGHPKGKAHGE